MRVTGYWIFEVSRWCFISLTTLILYYFYGKNIALSGVLGGFCALIPGLFFGIYLFRYKGARAAKRIQQSLYRAEAFKLALTVFLLVLVFSTIKIQATAFFIMYILGITSHWLAPLFLTASNSKRKSD